MYDIIWFNKQYILVPQAIKNPEVERYSYTMYLSAFIHRKIAVIDPQEAKNVIQLKSIL